MDDLVLILLATGGSGLLSAAIAGLFLLLPDRLRARGLPHLVSFATGALLAAALLALVPHALEDADEDRLHAIGATLVAGIGFFFILEKFLLWRHCHVDDCEEHGVHDAHGHVTPTDAQRRATSGTLVLVGDSIHNVLDGLLIAGAVLADPHLGLVTALAVAAHEIPQEVGDFAVLLHSGMSRRRAMFWNVLVSLTAVLGGLVGYFALREAQSLLPYALALAAAGMLYVAMSDLIPSLHRKVDSQASLAQFFWIAVGVAIIVLAERLAHGA
jgi:zinc and cadmium transporter